MSTSLINIMHSNSPWIWQRFYTLRYTLMSYYWHECHESQGVYMPMNTQLVRRPSCDSNSMIPLPHLRLFYCTKKQCSSVPFSSERSSSSLRGSVRSYRKVKVLEAYMRPTHSNLKRTGKWGDRFVPTLLTPLCSYLKVACLTCLTWSVLVQTSQTHFSYQVPGLYLQQECQSVKVAWFGC